MSRCFPFPPQGYEKKAGVEDTDLLAKEKHKEKKQKKDKKDKEKREGKEKKNKDKERSKEKHSNKKDRKEKRKDKKDRDKDKDKNRISDAKRIEGQPECYNGEKLGPNSMQINGIRDSKYVQDLAKRIRDEDRVTGSQIGQKITVTDSGRANLPGRMECSTEKLEAKEKSKDKKGDDKKVNGQRNHIEAKGLGNAIVQGFSGMDQKRFRGIAKPVENDIGKPMEEEEKNKHKDSDSKGEKQKDKDRGKKSKSKDKNKEKKEEEKAKEIIEASRDRLKLKDSPKLKDNGKGFINSCNVKPPDVLKTSSNNPAGEESLCKPSSNNPAGEGSLGKRKEIEINGISHDNGIRPNKLPRPVSSSHLVTKNGRKMEPYQTAVHFASEWQEAVSNHKVDIKEPKINGLRKASQPIVCSTKPVSIMAQGENGEASTKPLHPDCRYLNQILSVPKVEDWSDLDDQEWLFFSNSVRSKKSKVGSPGVDETRQVWAEVLQIESADVTALPYVIPF